MAARIELTVDALDDRRVERPEEQIDEMDAEVHHASAAGEARIVEPRLVRAVRIVEHRVGGIDVAERSVVKQRLQFGQLKKLKNTLRDMGGEELNTHLGAEYET